MSYANNMSKLIQKIEIDLGTDAYNLPDHLKKDKWVDVIELKTLDTFSRYFPNKVTMVFDTRSMKTTPDGYYLIDEDTIGPDVEILGIKDIPWDDIDAFGAGTGYASSISPYGLYDLYPASLSYEDMINASIYATEGSLLNRGVFIDFQLPNKIKLTSSLGIDGPSLGVLKFKVDVFIKHNKNLCTIEPTKMEIFERLAEADVATFLYNKLKFYDQLETVFSNSDLHLQELQDAANRRDDIVNEIKEGYVSMANKNQPGIMCI